MMSPWHLMIVLMMLLLATTGSLGSEGGVRKRDRPPLVEESGRRKVQRQTHCQFGNHSYELEERWRPDLGQPFGLLYCVRCECLPVQRKRKIMSRVRCKNIKNDCPKPTCDDPILLPERCCKTCEGEDYADLEEDIATRKLESEDDDKMMKEFSLLMTGRGLLPPVPAAGAARGYLTYTKRDLHYTIHYNGISRPKAVRFTNEEGTILEEYQVENVLHHVQNSKVCGVWRKLPKIYRRLLQKERLLVVLATEEYPDGNVAGRIMKNTQINTEVFGALLLPEEDSSLDTLGSGGFSMLFPVANSIHATLRFNGIFSSEDARDVPLTVKLLLETEDGQRNLVTETVVTLPKAHPDYNSVTAKLDLLPELQERLASAAFVLQISSQDGSRSQSGYITPKVTCNVFQALMIPVNTPDVNRISATGYVLLDIGADGEIAYKLHTNDWSSEPLMIALETEVETPSGTGVRRLQEIPQSYLSDSWANGTFSLTSSQEVEMLMTDDLMVTVAAAPSSQQRSELRGRIRQRLYTEAVLNENPILLSGGNTTAAGMAWLAIDKDCVLYYQVYVSGLDTRERHLVELLEVPPGKYSIPQQRILKRFDGEQAEDAADDLDGRSLARLHAGFTYLLVTSKLPGRSKAVQLKGRIGEIPVPTACLPRHDNSALQRSGHTYQDSTNDIYGLDSIHKCIYEGIVFDDGAQWKGEHEDCTMCFCQRGKVVCEQMVCPTPGCESPSVEQGDCCPTCAGSNSSTELPGIRNPRMCFFDGDKKFHSAGSRWHPYIPPFGFSRCALCTCESASLTVECKRITCPSLTCAEKESYREHPLACCKKCPNAIAVKSHILSPAAPGQLADQGGEKFTSKELMALGGCKFHGQVFPNGDEWHPTVQPFGEMKCVKCHCKDGRPKCKRQKCAKQSCAVKVTGDEDCCPKCIDAVDVSSSDVPRVKRKRKERERHHRRTRK